MSAHLVNPSILVFKGIQIGEIQRIAYWKDQFLVYDWQQNKIFLFDHAGNYVRTFGRIGKGPQEYIQIRGFAIDTDRDEVIVYADRPGKLIVFDLDGNVIREVTLAGRAYTDGVAYSSEYIFGFRSANRGEDGYSIARWKTDAPSLHQDFLAFTNWPAAISYGVRMTVADSGIVWVSRPFDNRIYRIDPSYPEPRARFTLDFGSANAANDYARNVNDEHLFRKAKSDEKVLHVAKVSQVRSHLFFLAITDYYMLDCHDGKVTKVAQVSGPGGMVCNFWNYIPLEYQNRQIAFIIPPEEITDALSENKWHKTPLLDSCLQANQPHQNPLLVLYNFRETR